MQISEQSHLTTQTMQSSNWYTIYTMQTIPHLQEVTSSLEQGCDLCKPIRQECDCPCPIILPNPISVTEADMTPSNFDNPEMITIIDLDSGRRSYFYPASGWTRYTSTSADVLPDNDSQQTPTLNNSDVITTQYQSISELNELEFVVGENDRPQRFKLLRTKNITIKKRSGSISTRKSTLRPRYNYIRM